MAILETLEKPIDSDVLQQRAREFSLERSLTQYAKVLQGEKA